MARKSKYTEVVLPGKIKKHFKKLNIVLYEDLNCDKNFKSYWLKSSKNPILCFAIAKPFPEDDFLELFSIIKDHLIDFLSQNDFVRPHYVRVSTVIVPVCMVVNMLREERDIKEIIENTNTIYDHENS